MTGPAPPDFDLDTFLPYLLNQAAEAASRGFEDIYRSRHGMTRTQWRVMANLGKFGVMSARDICAVSHIEKTKVSRAVASLERQELLTRSRSAEDRRADKLCLTGKGLDMFADLGRHALDYDRNLRRNLGEQMSGDLTRVLRAIMAAGPGFRPDHDD
jgi:DNA-binding MarR family transcriptional regulator